MKQSLLIRGKKIKTPPEIQSILNNIHFNFEKSGPTLMSPKKVLQKNRAHCFEGAILGAYLLSTISYKPYIMCLFAKRPDYDHVIAPFKIGNYWGALSKTNHAVLRYREPIYKNIRELVMSYFHEYFLNDGTKTLYAYSELLNLNDFENDWIDSNDDLWGIDQELDKLKKYPVLPKLYKKLRKADNVECRAGDIVEYKRSLGVY